MKQKWAIRGKSPVPYIKTCDCATEKKKKKKSNQIEKNDLSQIEKKNESRIEKKLKKN